MMVIQAKTGIEWWTLSLVSDTSMAPEIFEELVKDHPWSDGYRVVENNVTIMEWNRF